MLKAFIELATRTALLLSLALAINGEAQTTSGLEELRQVELVCWKRSCDLAVKAGPNLTAWNTWYQVNGCDFSFSEMMISMDSKDIAAKTCISVQESGLTPPVKEALVRFACNSEDLYAKIEPTLLNMVKREPNLVCSDRGIYDNVYSYTAWAASHKEQILDFFSAVKQYDDCSGILLEFGQVRMLVHKWHGDVCTFTTLDFGDLSPGISVSNALLFSSRAGGHIGPLGENIGVLKTVGMTEYGFQGQVTFLWNISGALPDLPQRPGVFDDFESARKEYGQLKSYIWRTSKRVFKEGAFLPRSSDARAKVTQSGAGERK